MSGWIQATMQQNTITILGGKFKFSEQDSDLEYLFCQQKNSPVSSDLKPPLNLDQ